jgi:hypothetical protein
MINGWRRPAALGITALLVLAIGMAPGLAQFPEPDPKGTPAPRPAQPGESPSPAPGAPGQAAPAPSPPPATTPSAPAPDDPRLTAGGALRAFMAARDYRTIRALKGTMTNDLINRFDKDSTPFCGKRGIRIVAFDFTENDLKAQVQKSKPGTAATAGVGAPAAAGGPGGAAAPAGPTVYTGTVRSLWAEQGEAFEKRTETVRIVRGADTLWRVAGLERGAVERLRFTEAIDGVTTVRMVLRAWSAGNFEAARPHLAASFVKKYAGREEALQALFVPAEGAYRHAAYRIVSLTPQGTTAADVEVQLFEAPAGQPAPIGGATRKLRLVKSGARWLVESWT